MHAKNIRPITLAALLAGMGSAAQAHGGHGPHELWDMLTHAVGIEQGLALLGLVIAVVVLRRGRARRDPNKPM